MNTNDRKQTGRIGLSMAINYFTLHGFTVSLPINDTQWYDLIVEKNGKFLTVQCKATATDNSSIDLRSSGGTNGNTYDHVFNHPVHLLFCVDKDLHIWIIPVKDLKDASIKSSFKLRTEPNKNNQGFETYKYLRTLCV